MNARRFLIIHGVENRRPPGHWQHQLAETLCAWPAIAGFAPPAGLDPASHAATSKSHIRLVCSDNDPYCPEGATAAYARPFDLDVDLIPGGGHLGEADGYGRWPSVAAWCRNGDVRVVAPHDNV